MRKTYGTMHLDNNDSLALKAYRIFEPKGTKNSDMIRHFRRIIIHLAGDIYDNKSRLIKMDKEMYYDYFKSSVYPEEKIDEAWELIYTSIEKHI